MIRYAMALIVLLAVGSAVHADIFRPAYLELTENSNSDYDVLWKVPALNDSRRLSANVRFPEGTDRLSEPRVVVVDGAWVERYRVRRKDGFTDEAIAIEGAAVGTIEVIVRVERLDGSSQVERLPPDNPVFVVKAPEGSGEIAWSYLILGVEHILGGFDHLLFLLALLLVVHGNWRIVATVTAFTVAHSMTLIAATLGFLKVATPPVEAIISLSIVFVAAEVIHGKTGKPGLTARAPWAVAFGFGLLHGLGFASALAEVGLPQAAIPLALLMFNVGVEFGQLLFIGAIIVIQLVARISPRQVPGWASGATAYIIGGLASYWTVERIVSFWPTT